MKIAYSENVKYSINLNENLIDIFLHYTSRKSEAGGILLGKISEHKINVLKASFPNIFDRTSRYTFIRDKRIAQILIDYEFHNNNKKMIYIGEWHTHWEDYPKPSLQDKRMIKEQFFKNKINEDFLLLIIIGIKGIYIGFYDGKDLFELDVSN